MSGVLVALLAVAAYFLWTLERKWAALPLLLGALYLGAYQQLDLGAHFTATRILIILGLVRVLVKRERFGHGWVPLDRAVICWGVWMVASTVFHKDGTLIFRLGMVLDTLGVYFLFRIFIHDSEEFVGLCRRISVLIAPLALAMVFEKATGRNCFEALGGVPGGAELRNGHFRARGPFLHQLASGNIAAACLPMSLYLWWDRRALALIGVISALCIVVATGSSGPIMSVAAVTVALGLWRVRRLLGAMRWLTVLGLIALDLVMNDPVYFLVARIDLTGGSTGYFRAALIRSSIMHLSEWWLAGTDRTRHWMPSGIPADEDNTDITNHYLAMGVMGGLLLMGLFLWILFAAFAALGRALRWNEDGAFDQQFLLWVLGAILFAHATSFWSISYWDPQSLLFLFFCLAAIGSVAVATTAGPAPETAPSIVPGEPEIRSSVAHFQRDVAY
jgi:hypothetical protein